MCLGVMDDIMTFLISSLWAMIFNLSTSRQGTVTLWEDSDLLNIFFSHRNSIFPQ